MLVAQITHLTQDALDISRPFSAARVRNDAIMTKVIATTHNAHKATHFAYH